MNWLAQRFDTAIARKIVQISPSFHLRAFHAVRTGERKNCSGKAAVDLTLPSDELV
jgi:hypothetical protein